MIDEDDAPSQAPLPDYPVAQGWLAVFRSDLRADVHYHVVGPYVHLQDALRRGQKQKGFIGPSFWSMQSAGNDDLRRELETTLKQVQTDNDAWWAARQRDMRDSQRHCEETLYRAKSVLCACGIGLLGVASAAIWVLVHA